jgi:hypothetical protein
MRDYEIRAINKAGKMQAPKHENAVGGGKADKVEIKKDPVVGSTGPRIQLNDLEIRGSCRLRCLLFGYAFCLRTFLSLDNFELDVITLLEALITLRLDGTVMDEHIGPVIPANKAEALCVIEPFHFTFDSRHVPCSLRSPETRSYCGPKDRFPSLSFATALGRDGSRPD